MISIRDVSTNIIVEKCIDKSVIPVEWIQASGARSFSAHNVFMQSIDVPVLFTERVLPPVHVPVSKRELDGGIGKLIHLN